LNIYYYFRNSWKTEQNNCTNRAKSYLLKNHILSTDWVRFATEFIKGSVYFTGDIQQIGWSYCLCRQSIIQSRGLTQYKEKGHFVRKTLSCSWCNG